MSLLSDPFWGRVIITVLLAIAMLVIVFSIDIFLYVTKRDFWYLHVMLVRYTQHEHKSTSKKVLFRTLDVLNLRKDVLRNRFLYWVVLVTSLRVTEQNPVLHFGDRVDTVLGLVRASIVRRTINAELKRSAGLPFVVQPYVVCVIYDRSDDKRRYVLRAMLIREDDLLAAESQVARSMPNKRNRELMAKIVLAYQNGRGSFIDADITAS